MTDLLPRFQSSAALHVQTELAAAEVKSTEQTPDVTLEGKSLGALLLDYFQRRNEQEGTADARGELVALTGWNAWNKAGTMIVQCVMTRYKPGSSELSTYYDAFGVSDDGLGKPLINDRYMPKLDGKAGEIQQQRGEAALAILGTRAIANEQQK